MKSAAKSVQHSKSFRELRRSLASLEFDKEAQAYARGGGKLWLSKPLSLPGVADEFANLGRGHDKFPDRDITKLRQKDQVKMSRPGNFRSFKDESSRNTPIRKLLRRSKVLGDESSHRDVICILEGRPSSLA
jgi:hypothetical protein